MHVSISVLLPCMAIQDVFTHNSRMENRDRRLLKMLIESVIKHEKSCFFGRFSLSFSLASVKGSKQMLGSLAASNAAKIAALCICPVGAAVVVTQVPQVRSAVHKVTAPRHAPARRIAPRATPAANIPAQTAMASPCPSTPVLTQGGEALTFSTPSLGATPFDLSLPPSRFASVSTPINRVDFGSSPAPTDMPDDFSALPEPGTWLQFGLGFALLGSAIRSSGASKKASAAKDAMVS